MVRATSAAVLAVVAMNAASTMAFPSFGFGKRAVNGDSTTGKPVPATPVSNEVPAGKGVPRVLQAEGGILPTKTLMLPARATPCKAGEHPNDKQQLLGGRPLNQHGSQDTLPHRKDSSLAEDSKRGDDSRRAAPAPHAVAARAVPTQEGSKPALLKEEPTPAPKSQEHHGHGSVVDVAQRPKVYTTTHMGKNGHQTVYHLVRPTNVPCKPAKDIKVLTPPERKTDAYALDEKHGDAKQPPVGTEPVLTKTASDPKLVARAADLVERYFNELDELD